MLGNRRPRGNRKAGGSRKPRLRITGTEEGTGNSVEEHLEGNRKRRRRIPRGEGIPDGRSRRKNITCGKERNLKKRHTSRKN